MGKWRSRRGSSTPCCSVSVRPQRRQVVLVSILSTVRMSSLALVSSVWRTRTSGISSGIEISECFGIRSILQIKHESWPHSAPSAFAVQPLYLVVPTATPEEPKKRTRHVLPCPITERQRYERHLHPDVY